MYHSYGYGLGEAEDSEKQDKTVLWCSIGSAAVSGYLGFQAGGPRLAAIWGGAGAVVPQVLDRLHKWAVNETEWGKKLPARSTTTAVIGCAIVPVYAFSQTGPRALGFGGMF